MTVIEVVEEGFDEKDENINREILDNKEGWVFMLCNLKAFLEFGICELRSGLVK